MYIYKQRHKLTNIDLKDKKANCSVCGMTDIKKTPASKTANCKNAIHARRKEIRNGIKFEKIPEKYSKAASKEAVHRNRAKRKGQLPVDADVNLMRNIYAECPKGYEVDHIEPIAHGGLHHQNNLQYLPIEQNRRKSCGDNYDKSTAIKWSLIVA